MNAGDRPASQRAVNILIDKHGDARLADFGLLTIVSDPTNFTASSPFVISGTIRRMSPELLGPGQLGIEDSRRRYFSLSSPSLLASTSRGYLNATSRQPYHSLTSTAISQVTISAVG